MTGRQSNMIKWFSENKNDASLASFLFVDICELDNQQEILGRSIIDLLLKNKPLNIPLKANREIDQKLFQLFVNNENSIQFTGVNHLAIGYPLIQLKDKQGKPPSFAPLFIWEARLINENPLNEGWRLERSEEMSVRINHSLQHYILKHYKIDLQKLSSPALNNRNLNTISLTKICYELSTALGEKEDVFVENIIKVLPVGPKCIQCSAIIANFSEDTLILEERRTPNKKDLPELSFFGQLTLDPWQERAFKSFLQQKHTKVFAHSGTGKSHLLNFILINSLSKGLNNLVVTENQGKAKMIRNTLSAHGLDHLIFEIKNPVKDVKKLAQALQYKSQPSKESFDEEHFNFLSNKCQRILDRLNTDYSSLEKPVFNKISWSEIVGYYLTYNRLEKKELLENQLDPKLFTFHPTEFLSLLEAVKNTKPIYKKINTLKHPLSLLHADLFLEKNCTEAFEWLTQQVNYFHQKFSKLHYRYMIKQQDYSADLVAIYNSFLKDAVLKIESITDQIEDNKILYGKAFEDSGILQTGKLKVYGVFSNKHKNILQARNEIEEKIRLLIQSLKLAPDTGFKVPENPDSKSVAGITMFLQKLDDYLHQWYDNTIQNLPEDLQRLNSKSVYPGLDYAEQINELEYTLDMNVEELNSSGLYKVPLQNRMLTIPMRQLFITDVLEQLERIRNHFNQFEDFYSWQRHWLLLPDVHQSLIAALIKVNPKDWTGAFQSWYYYKRLKLDYHFNIPVDDEKLETFYSAIQNYRKQLPAQIRFLWARKQSKSKSTKGLIKLSPEDLLDNSFELIKNHFPIIIASKQVVNQVFNRKTVSFDQAFLISDEEVTNNLHYISNRSLAFYSDQENEGTPLSNRPALKFRHKKVSHTAFYLGKAHTSNNDLELAILPDVRKSTFEVRRVGGRFRQNINIKEAEVIVNDLIALAQSDDESNFKILVVCTTVDQRDFILKKLFLLQKSNAPEAIYVDKLFKNQLGVFYILERKPSSYDYLIFSVGVEKLSGAPDELSTVLNTKPGFQHLEKMMNGCWRKVSIYHSISEDDLNDYVTFKAKKSIRLLANWISNSKDLSPGTGKQANEKSDESESILNHQIANELIPFIGKHRIKQNIYFRGFYFPLLIDIDGDGSKVIAILLDNCIVRNYCKSYLWNKHFKDCLKSEGIIPVTVWSANWFNNPPLEARRLASYILKLDKGDKVSNAEFSE